MLTAESIIAKIVSFIVEKVGGKLLALPFDKRRKACRSLTKLYYCVQALDDVAENFLHTLRHFEQTGDASAVVNALNNHAHEVELATNMFVDLGHELYGGLEIIDPVLAKCCSTLYVSKCDFLDFMSDSIHWDRSGVVAKAVIKRPLGKMEGVEMDDLYRHTECALRAGEKVYWPSSALDEFSNDFEVISIGFEDDAAALQFRELIQQQNKTLKVAKERLRTLIKDSFTIEEVLFQSDSHPYR